MEAKINKEVMQKRRKHFEDLMKRRFFYNNGFEIYGGVAGLFDLGPIGCAIQTNIISLWREFFILEEDMLEISCTNLTPAPGHVDRFTDLMVKDVKTGQAYRADKLLTEVLEKRLQSKNPPANKEEIELIINTADSLKKEEMDNTLKKHNIKAPDTNNDLTSPEEFNLMFNTNIGPTGQLVGYLRPETAQGIFVNFSKLLDFNQSRMPFAGAQIGLGFRNEISPRGGLLRVREFLMAEIEHFVDPLDKTHPKYEGKKNKILPLWPQKNQLENLPVLEDLTLEVAVEKKIINNETLAYFMCRTYEFLEAHLPTEMAHYAADCWDCEIETSYGWIECVGIADRACYDLSSHAKATKSNLVASRRLEKPEKRKITEYILNKGKIASQYKQKTPEVTNAFEDLNENQKKEGYGIICEKGEWELSAGIVLKQDMLQVKEKEVTVQEEKFVPSVIEPSFGIGRILYSLLEQSFIMRDEKRTYLKLNARVAPVKCSILPVISCKEFTEIVHVVRSMLVKNGISVKIDDSGQSIGKRYSRTDELGIPFGLTIDKQTLDDKSVTMREIFTMKQIRIPINDLPQIISDLINFNVSWGVVLEKYPAFEVKEKE